MPWVSLGQSRVARRIAGRCGVREAGFDCSHDAPRALGLLQQATTPLACVACFCGNKSAPRRPCSSGSLENVVVAADSRAYTCDCVNDVRARLIISAAPQHSWNFFAGRPAGWPTFSPSQSRWNSRCAGFQHKLYHECPPTFCSPSTLHRSLHCPCDVGLCISSSSCERFLTRSRGATKGRPLLV